MFLVIEVVVVFVSERERERVNVKNGTVLKATDEIMLESIVNLAFAMKTSNESDQMIA